MTTEIICVKCLDKENEIIKLREALEEIVKVDKHEYRSDYSKYNEMLRIANKTLAPAEVV